MYERIKALLSDDTVYYALLLLCIGLVSFGLGRWSELGGELTNQQANIVFSESVRIDTEVINQVTRSPDLSEKKFVASKNGSKYHLPWCPGVKQMKEENKIWFADIAAAQAAGYTPAGNCKGL